MPLQSIHVTDHAGRSEVQFIHPLGELLPKPTFIVPDFEMDIRLRLDQLAGRKHGETWTPINIDLTKFHVLVGYFAVPEYLSPIPLGDPVMTIARKDIVVDGEVGLYHCRSRCVRRAFLCGFDRYSSTNYDHRKRWVKARLRHLRKSFAIDIATATVMSNHTHLVLRTRPDLAEAWDDREVARRWLWAYPKRKDEHGFACEPEDREIAALCEDEAKVKVYRSRLGSLSWFMAALNEHIARKSNREDDCTGRFWEGRFKCTRLLDEASVLACMAYVDLNPIRAQIAHTPENSEFAGIYDRILARQARKKVLALSKRRKAGDRRTPLSVQQKQRIREQMASRKKDRWMAPMDIRRRDKAVDLGLLPLTRDEYLELVEWTGRQIRSDKRGAIPRELAPILKRMNLDVEGWVELVLGFGSLFWRVAGGIEALVRAAQRAGRRWFKGVRRGLNPLEPTTG